MMKEIRYYWINTLGIVGKREEWDCCIFREGKWIQDREMLVMDRLMGYDPYEDDDSPYKIGNLSIMNEIEEISESEAMNKIKQH